MTVPSTFTAEPKPEDFHLSAEDTQRWESFFADPLRDHGPKLGIAGALIGLVIGAANAAGVWRIPFAIFGAFTGLLIGYMAGGLLIIIAAEAAKAFSSSARRFKKYEAAHDTYRRQQTYAQEVFWRSLSGFEFEQQLASLLRSQGFDVIATGRSGDRGIDLVVSRDAMTSVVQCKTNRNPIGPAVVRELYGAMLAVGATRAILACTGGVTPGVIEFASDKPIKLLGLREIVRMAQGEDALESPLADPKFLSGRG